MMMNDLFLGCLVNCGCCCRDGEEMGGVVGYLGTVVEMATLKVGGYCQGCRSGIPYDGNLTLSIHFLHFNSATSP